MKMGRDMKGSTGISEGRGRGVNLQKFIGGLRYIMEQHID